jgi:hypothetical protein
MDFENNIIIWHQEIDFSLGVEFYVCVEYYEVSNLLSYWILKNKIIIWHQGAKLE